MRRLIMALVGFVTLAVPTFGFANNEATVKADVAHAQPTDPAKQIVHPEHPGVLTRNEALEALEMAAAQAEDARQQWEAAEREHSQVHPWFVRPTMHPNKLHHS